MSGWWLVSYVVLWALLAATVLLLLIVLRQLGLIYLRTKTGGLRLDDGPPVGQIITPFGEIDLHSSEEFLFPDGRSHLNLLIFASPACGLCKDALAGLGGVRRGRDINTLVLSFGTPEANEVIRRLTRGEARLALNLERQHAIGVQTIPYAIAMTGEGVILAKRIVNHVEDLEDLLEDAERQPDLRVVALAHPEPANT